MIEKKLLIPRKQTTELKNFNIQANSFDIYSAIQLIGSVLLAERGEESDYIIDKVNEETIVRIVSWITNNRQLSICRY